MTPHPPAPNINSPQHHATYMDRMTSSRLKKRLSTAIRTVLVRRELPPPRLASTSAHSARCSRCALRTSFFTCRESPGEGVGL